ncbi:MAG: IMP cyclohydrolase [Proteobacteria bacterium]|nr:IMP cyclohydrolase [Pseudomonadota bacterium]
MAEDLKKMYRTVVAENFPPRMEVHFVDGDARQVLAYEKVTWEVGGERKGLRYGENPGQEAALYRLANGNLTLGEVTTLAPGRWLVSDAELLQSGKHPGKTNLTDADNALNILRYLTDSPTAIIVKHNNPCGAAQAGSLEEAYAKAYMADRVAAFGGCIAVSASVDKATAEAISAQYAEVVVAPDFEEGVLDILAQRKNLRVMAIRNMDRLASFASQRVVDFKSLMDGGIVAQWSFVPQARKKEDLPLATTTHQGVEIAVNRAPTDSEYADMLFGWLVEAGVTSNSVLYIKDRCTVGIGTGEQDRVGVAQIARDKAYRKLADRYCFQETGTSYNDLSDPDQKAEIDDRVAREKGGLPGSAMVSDAFFPFRDGVMVGLSEGVTAVIQPGGAQNDRDVIAAVNEHNATMVFTGQRSFKH